jgi:hypothetical protein
MSTSKKHDLEKHDKRIPGIGVKRFYLAMPSDGELRVMMPSMTTDSIDIILGRQTLLVGRLP